jgi:succinate dehydrogenase/fumarate reductase flavoprotein subunit
MKIRQVITIFLCMILGVTIPGHVSGQTSKKSKSRGFATKTYRIKLRRFGLYDLLTRKGLSDAYLLKDKLQNEMNKTRIRIRNKNMAKEEAMRQKELQEHFHVNGVKSQNFLMDFHAMRYF